MSSKSVKSPKAPKETVAMTTAISDAFLAFVTLYCVSLLYQSAEILADTGRITGARYAMFQRVACVAFGLMGVAAAVGQARMKTKSMSRVAQTNDSYLQTVSDPHGTFRFAGVFALKPLHEFLAGWSMFTSMPLLSLIPIFGYSSMSPDSLVPYIVFFLLTIVFIAFRTYPRQLLKYQEDYVTAVGVFGLMTLLWKSILMVYGSFGAVEEDEIKAAAYKYSAGINGIFGSLLVVLAGVGITTKGQRKFGPLTILNVDAFHYVMMVANVCLVHMIQEMFSWA